ncbi:hypothetical protein LINPERHAP2_LOCUS9258 [Linum perenne]
MDVRVEMLVYHGGRMKIHTRRSAEYEGGQVAEVDVLDDYVCYFQLKKIGTELLKYDSVERLWFVPPSGLLGADLREIRDDTDEISLREAAKNGVVSLYMEATKDGSITAYNEDSEGCKWRVYASWYGRNEAYIVKAVGLPHNCPRPDRNRSATAKWILSKYFNRFRIDPDLKTKHLVREISETHGIAVSMRVCSNAKQLAKRMLEGTLAESYSKLRSYVKQLQTSDPRGHFILEVDPVHVEEYVLFKRIFVGFSCLRRGFRVACRRMFGLDGCFLKGEVKWMLLSAVGKDGNNQMFPIAWAVVEGENRSSWTWFIE